VSAGILLVLGGCFMLLAAVGLLRLPDLLLRMSATAKAATLGAALSVLGASLHFGDPGTVARAVVIIAFLFLTAPVASHMIGRAGYHKGMPLWEGTIADEGRPSATEESPSESRESSTRDDSLQ
jgi:multicomponent Na+:H+ antiporter subunit G